MKILETNNLNKRYKTNYALKDVNMNIEEGDVYGFVGENGAGKTTLIRTICGLIIPSGGSYSLFGVSSKDEKAIVRERKKMAAIVESPSLNKAMTARENIILQLKMYGESIDEEKITTLLKTVGLDEENIKKKKVKDFSLGMRQRLGIALTLIGNPKFIVLDEPMNGLDPKGFIEVRELILELNKKGITFLISSHILEELEKVCTKIGFLSHGKLIEEISMKDLHNKTRNSIGIILEDPLKLKEVLSSKLNINDTMIEGNCLKIFGEVNINEIMEILVNEKINVLSIENNKETIEEYYLKLMMEVK